MNAQLKNYLIIGGVALAAYLVYKKMTTGTKASPIAKSTAGTGNSVAAATGNGSGGSTDFWSTLGSAGKGLNGAVSSVESTYNSIYDLFGGNSSSVAPTGNNSTGG